MERGGGVGGWVLVGAWEGVMGLSWGGCWFERGVDGIAVDVLCQ